MKIVVDAMGGDFAPKVNVDGAIDALREYPDMDIILVGPQALVAGLVAGAFAARAATPLCRATAVARASGQR